MIDLLVILAGGLGTRLQTVVNDVPKPMASVDDKPFLECLLEQWRDYDVQQVILSVGYKHNVIYDYFGTSYRGIPLGYVIEDTPMGTGGAILKVIQEKQLNDYFYLVNGDTCFTIDPRQLRDSRERHRADMVMALRQVDTPDRYHTITLDDDNRVIASAEGKTALMNAGMYYLHPRIMDDWSGADVPLSFENDLFPALFSNSRVYGEILAGRFIDIGIPGDYARAESFFME